MIPQPPNLAQRLAAQRPLRIGLIAAMDEEVAYLEAALARASEPPRVESRAGFDFYLGTLGGESVVLLKSGIGKVNAAVGTSLMLERYQPDCIINSGSAGGFSADLEIGDLVISSEVRQHDFDLSVFGYEPGQVAGMPPAFVPDPSLVRIALREAAAETGVKAVTGLIATGDAFMDCPERVAATRARFPDMLAVEMEAGAVAQTCYRFGTPFVIIRALSDIAGKSSSVSFKEFLAQAGTQSGRRVEQLVQALGAASRGC